MAARRRSTRVAAWAAAVALMTSISAACVPVASGAEFSHALHIELVYQGYEEANFSAVGQPTSVFKAPQLYKRQQWDVRWDFECTATLPDGSPIGTQIACDDEHGDVTGEYQLRYLVGPGEDCYSTLTRGSAPYTLIGSLQSKHGDVFRLEASEPAEGPVMLALDPCGYPPSVNWHGDINTTGLTKSLLTHNIQALGVGIVTGDNSGWQGQAKFASVLTAYIVKEVTPEPTQDTRANYQKWMDQIGQWVTDGINGLRWPDDGFLKVPPEPSPYLGPDGIANHLNGQVTADDPLLLTRFSQPLSRGRPTRLDASLNGSVLAQFAKASSPPTLHISLTIRPLHGTPVHVAENYVPSLVPLVSSVSFAGSPADPTITVHGSDLGPSPKPNPSVLEGTNGCPTAPGTYGTDYGESLSLSVPSANWGAGTYIPGTEIDCIGILPSSSSQSQVTFMLGSFYKAHPSQFSLAQGDGVEVGVNGAFLEVHVAYGSTVTS